MSPDKIWLTEREYEKLCLLSAILDKPEDKVLTYCATVGMDYLLKALIKDE